MLRVEHPADLLDHVGESLGESDWWLVDQERIDRFAEATEDRQWIHLDRERAAAGPFGTTIAHGYLTLSLLAPIIEQTLRVERAHMVINYGLNRVRFPAPVPAGSRVRGRVVLAAAVPVDGGVQAELEVAVEREQGGKPACVAVMVLRVLGEARAA